MFYINTHKKFQPIKQKQLLTAIITPPQQRQSKDHQLIYRFFNDSQMLKQLQRTKSLNARKKCIQSLLLINAIDYNKQQHIIMHYLQDQRFIILPLSAKIKAQNYDQKIIRKRMDSMREFSIFQSLKYDELLHMANHLEEDICKYKEYLYREGDQSVYFYLILQGEVYYQKYCNQDQAGIHLKNKKGHKRQNTQKDDDENPNKMVRSQIKQYKLGVVQGQLGQSVGLQEIILDQQSQKRQNSVICNSTDTKLIKIHKKYIQQIFQEFPKYKEKLKIQIQSKKLAKQQLFNKIKQTKLNINQVIKKSLQKIQKEQVINHMRTFQKNKQASQQQDDRHKLPFIEKKSSFSLQNRHYKVFRSSLSVQKQTTRKDQHSIITLKSQSNIRSIQKQDIRYEQEDEDDQVLFGMTALKSKSYSKSNKKTIQKSQHLQHSKSRQSIGYQVKLPLLNNKKSITDVDISQIKMPDLKIKRRSNHYGSMIDSSKLIKQKQNIIQRKLYKVSRDQIFPIGHIQYKQPLRSIQQDPMKLKASPAHSNLFMEKLLLKVLKKAGYDQRPEEQELKKEQQKQSNMVKNVKIKRENHRSMTKNKKKQDDKIEQIKEELLVNSAFDDYYFKKV